jgi:hypothetical protein
MLPKEFSLNPLVSIADILQEHGTPFEEQRDSGLDAKIEWRRRDALIGTDPPDPELEPLSNRESYPATN